MQILHVITRGDVGGAQTHVVELAAAQAALGDVASIMTGCDGPAMDRARALGIDVEIVPSLADARASGSLRNAYRDLDRRLTAVDADIVHSHSSHAGLLARAVCRRRGLVSVYTAHGWPFQKGATWRQRLSSLAGEAVGGRLGDAVICLTDAEAARARRARVVAPDRVWVVPNGIVDVPESSRRLAGTTTGPIGLVMVARFAPPKMQFELIGALAGVADRDWTLTFVGDGPGRVTCEALAARLHGDRVRFLGHRDDVVEILAANDVALLWSRYEGMPMALLEGMRAGLCCVSSDLPGSRVLFGSPPAGLLVDGQPALVAGLRELFDDPGRIDALGARARDRYERSYTAGAMAQAVRTVYEQVGTQSGRRGQPLR